MFSRLGSTGFFNSPNGPKFPRFKRITDVIQRFNVLSTSKTVVKVKWIVISFKSFSDDDVKKFLPFFSISSAKSSEPEILKDLF